MSAWELRHGRWQDVLADVTRVDAVICDPPYSARTHEGQRTGSSDTGSSSITYAPTSPEEVQRFCTRWNASGPRWFVMFSDHIAADWWRASMDEAGLNVFAPVRWVKPDPAPRMQGDGPTCSTEDIVVARQRNRDAASCGSLPGHYICGVSSLRGGGVPGAKPLDLMRQIIRDYSRPGDLICDPFAGSGTTLLAAVMEGRRAIGAEMDAGRYALARKRLEAYDVQPQLPGVVVHAAKQEALFSLAPKIAG